jgi:large subunit ribosomal protein L9
MEVVLKQDVDALGLRGDVVNVARGYARNFLLPRGLAELATPGLKRELERRDEQRARHEAKSVDEARAIAARFDALELRFDVTAGPTGSLFGSVTATNVADRLWEAEKLRVDRRKLQMDTIKRIGRYTVSFEVFPDVVAELKLVVAPEGEELPPAEELAALEAQEIAEAEAATAAKQAAPEYLPELDEAGGGPAVTPAEAAERADDMTARDAPAPAEPPQDETVPDEAVPDAAMPDEPGEDEPAA